MDERLEKALEFSNYMVTLNNQKRIIKEQFRENIIFYFQGGQFTVNKELITFVNMLVEKENTEDIVLIDDNETPIMVDDLKNFLDNIINCYFSAANQYHSDYKILSASRSIEKLVDYEK
jgi:hypothetical protein